MLWWTSTASRTDTLSISYVTPHPLALSFNCQTDDEMVGQGSETSQQFSSSERSQYVQRRPTNRWEPTRSPPRSSERRRPRSVPPPSPPSPSTIS